MTLNEDEFEDVCRALHSTYDHDFVRDTMSKMPSEQIARECAAMAARFPLPWSPSLRDELQALGKLYVHLWHQEQDASKPPQGEHLKELFHDWKGVPRDADLPMRGRVQSIESDLDGPQP